MKSKDEFRERKSLKRGFQSWCRECENKAGKGKYIPKERKPKVLKSDEEIKLAAKRRMLKYRYNITLEEYEEMYIKQDKKCAICKDDYELGGHKGLFVDHDHKTMEVRGLLCRKCNSAIGQLNESRDILIEAVKYLSVQSKQDFSDTDQSI